MKKGDLNSRGFTIIEVALVLAIAGLIFLMVFIALPGLRASQRDTERRENIISFVNEVKAYQRNNRGALPGGTDTAGKVEVTWNSANNSSNKETSWNGFYRDYLGEKFVDPSGENYKLTVLNCDVAKAEQPCKTTSPNQILGNIYNTAFPNEYKILVVKQATCYGDHAVASANPRHLATLYRLERGGVYCSSN